MPVWSVSAVDNPNDGGRSAEHAVAADRFAREIVPFLTRFGGALAAAERQAVRHPWQGGGLSFLMEMWRIGLPERASCHFRCADARCAGVVRTPVVLAARCAEVVPRPVVRKARYG